MHQNVLPGLKKSTVNSYTVIMIHTNFANQSKLDKCLEFMPHLTADHGDDRWHLRWGKAYKGDRFSIYCSRCDTNCGNWFSQRWFIRRRQECIGRWNCDRWFAFPTLHVDLSILKGMDSRYHTITITTGGEVWDLARRLVVSPFPLALISSGNFFSVPLFRCVPNLQNNVFPTWEVCFQQFRSVVWSSPPWCSFCSVASLLCRGTN